MRDWRTERMFDGIVQSRCVSLAVERQGKTDCRECVFRGETLTGWAMVCTIGNGPAFIYGTGPEYCGDFVERIL